MARMERGKIVRDNDDYDPADYGEDGLMTPEAERRERMARLHRSDPATAIEVEVALLEGRLSEAEGEEAAIIETQIAAWRRVATRRSMSKFDDAYTAAQTALTTGMVAVTAALKQVDEDAAVGKITPQYAEHERARLLTEARIADGRADRALTAYAADALKEARALRARAAVGDPQTVIAEEMLRARLTADSRYDPENYVEEAQTFLEAGIPARAALLAEVAAVKGARVPTALTRAINDALDASVPERKQAREIETGVEANTAAFRVSRAHALADTLGTDAQGNIGTGTLGERTTANVAAKMAAHLALQPAGE